MHQLPPWPPRGHLRIHATPACGRGMVAPLLNGFHAQYPDIVLELLLGERPPDADVWFAERRPQDEAVAAYRLLPIPLMVCASSTYASAHGLPRRVAELADHRCISFRTSSGLVREWEFRINGQLQRYRPFAQHTFNDEALIVQTVRAGLGLAQLPDYLVSGLLAEEKLVSCLAPYAPDAGSLYLFCSGHQYLHAHVRAFVDYALSSLRQFHSPR